MYHSDPGLGRPHARKTYIRQLKVWPGKLVQSLRFWGAAQCGRRTDWALVNIMKLGNANGTRTITTMARQWKQCLAARRSNVRRPAEHTGAEYSLRRHRQKEMGDQLRLHGNVCLR